MIVTVDDEILEIDEKFTLSELMKSVNKKIEKNNRIIYEVYIDEKKIDLENDLELLDIKIVEIVTKSPKLLLLEALKEMEAYIQRFYSTIDEIYMYLSNDNYEIVSLVVKAVEGLEWIYSVISSALDITSVDFAKLGIKDTYFNFEFILNYFLIIVKKEDYLSLENFLKGDLREFLGEIESKIPILYNAVLAEEKEDRIKA